MATLDGMDPQLVRQLLAEVRGAAKHMRTIESKITGLMSRAGVPAQVTHRPSQVADSCDEMARDVSARLALLEKEEKQKTPTPEPTNPDPPKSDQPKDAPTSENAPKGEKAPKDTGEPNSPKGKDEPEKNPPHEKPDAPREKPDAKGEKPTGKDAPEQPADPPKGDKDAPRSDGEDAPKGDKEGAPREKPDAKGEKPDVNGEDAPKGDKEDVPREKPDAKGEKPDVNGEDAPKRDKEDAPRADRDHDSRSECEERNRVDTPKKDHPDDTDTSQVGRPRIIDVDGVKVVQVPLDPPTVEEIRDLLENLERAQPMEMPTAIIQDTNPAPDGSTGQLDGVRPTPSTPDDPGYGTERIIHPQPGDSCATLPPANGDDRPATGDERSLTQPPATGGDGQPDGRPAQPFPTAGPDVIAPTPPPGMEADTALPEGDTRQPADGESERRPSVIDDSHDVQPPSADARTPAELPATEGDRQPARPVADCPAPSGVGESDQPRDTGGARDGGDTVRPSQPDRSAQPQPRPLPFGEVGSPGPQRGPEGPSDVEEFITLLNGEDAVTRHGEAGRDHSPPVS